MQKHVHLVVLVESFQTNIFLQILASIKQRTSLVKFAMWGPVECPALKENKEDTTVRKGGILFDMFFESSAESDSVSIW